MKILVTGGCGFIGSNFIRFMFKKRNDIEIVNLDKLTYAGNIENLRDIEGKFDYRFVRGDIRDEALVDGLITEGFDAVLNFAAESHVDRSIAGPRPFIETDVLGTFTLLEVSLRREVPKFIQISTDEVYGSIEDGSFDENSALCPSSPYSASKASADLIALSCHKTYGIPVMITRSSNNFGPHQYPEKLIPLFITNAIENRKLPLYGDGKNVRDWLYVTDNCRAIDMVLEKGSPGEVYNIGGGVEKSNIEITRLILNILGKDESLIEYVRDRPGHDRRYSLECSKIASLGFLTGSNFEEKLKETVDWYVENRWFWKERAPER
ncbi:MAG: dTDP-glucose 4,6-dehydratase [Actinomycetota bacterium]|nr:dTDP-glucose 4,6-dehydratase [Actinomycetota bacterium]